MTKPLEDRVLLLESMLDLTIAELHSLKLGTSLWMMERLPDLPPMEMLAPIIQQRLYFKGAIERVRSRKGPWQIFAQTLQSYDQQIEALREVLEAAGARPRGDIQH